MEIHHGKHHAAYTSKLNAIEGTDMTDCSIELLEKHSDNGAVRNNGGGFFNHNLFWAIMSPQGSKAPEGDLAIDRDFGSFDQPRILLHKLLLPVLVQAGLGCVCTKRNP